MHIALHRVAADFTVGLLYSYVLLPLLAQKDRRAPVKWQSLLLSLSLSSLMTPSLRACVCTTIHDPSIHGHGAACEKRRRASCFSDHPVPRVPSIHPSILILTCRFIHSHLHTPLPFVFFVSSRVSVLPLRPCICFSSQHYAFWKPPLQNASASTIVKAGICNYSYPISGTGNLKLPCQFIHTLT